MILKSVAAILLLLWLMLFLMGKGGFVHILLLTGLGVASVEILYAYRVRVMDPDR